MRLLRSDESNGGLFLHGMWGFAHHVLELRNGTAG